MFLFRTYVYHVPFMHLRNSSDRDRLRMSTKMETSTLRRLSGSEQTSEIRGFDIEGDISSYSPLKMKPLPKGGSPPFRSDSYVAEVPSLSGTPEGYTHYSTTATLSTSPVPTTPTTPLYSVSSVNGTNFNVTTPTPVPVPSSHVTPTKSERLDDSMPEYAWDSPSEYQSPPAKNNDRMTSERDTARMLRGLGSASSSAEKALAARELRHLVRTADDVYWTEHCPQVHVLMRLYVTHQYSWWQAVPMQYYFNGSNMTTSIHFTLFSSRLWSTLRSY